MKKKRGGQRKHWAEKARVWVWYREIKRRCHWSDYVLDHAFAWTEEGEAARSIDCRPRAFEWIRKIARKPAGQDPRWRGMPALVAAVDQHPLFHGTQALYMAELWDVLQEQTSTPGIVQMRIDRLLQSYGLVRINPDTAVAITKLIEKYGREQVFDRCLMLSLRRMDSMSGMALVWLLYLQTEPSHNWRFREILESIADKQLDDFFSYYFSLDLHLTYYTDAIHTLQHIRLDMSERPPYGYGYIETIGTWPILPEDLIDSISAEQLFALDVL
ncbi:MAG: hypothetical protein ACXW11_10850 [Methylotenera sp.]